MSLVVDTSVIISVITNEITKSNLIKITKGEDLIAPESLHWEVGNAFSAMFKREIISIELVKKAIEYYQMIPLRLVEVNLFSSLEISKRFNIYAYDAYFIECANNYNLPLISLDKKLIEIAKKMNLKVIEV
ncbi:MAG: type II toxin-antitoxin system VapC family toxin [Ignavibacteriae bacterium]|nr:type II toxin-antitoxin system VapC family toxin [Ignavibacteriota bacterium]